ncbi:Alpha/Beta hydrolase protein [Boletus edulis]|nr:Alpha/Beta hydrolase protein [Boletus edulis]
MVITSIRVTDVALGLRQLPVRVGFYAMVHHSGLEWRTEIKSSSMNDDVVEWDGSIPIPPDLSVRVCLEVYAPFEFRPTLGTGEQLRNFTITVEQLFDCNAQVVPFSFFPVFIHFGNCKTVELDHLDGRWGVMDVLDCARAAHVLSSPPYSLVDPARCVIRGLSAGGYTVLSYAAGSYRDTPSPVQTDTAFSFRAGVSHFGGTGRPDEPEMADVYHRRSPVFHADSITTMPLLMLQGLADHVVPPEQSQAMVDAIVSHGGSDRVKYKTYEGEGHGFSRADTNRSALEEEATWFVQWLGINPYLTNHYLPTHMGVEPITRYKLIRLEAPLRYYHRMYRHLGLITKIRQRPLLCLGTVMRNERTSKHSTAHASVKWKQIKEQDVAREAYISLHFS